jgi:hypothetical protein
MQDGIAKSQVLNTVLESGVVTEEATTQALACPINLIGGSFDQRYLIRRSANTH